MEALLFSFLTVYCLLCLVIYLFITVVHGFSSMTILGKYVGICVCIEVSEKTQLVLAAFEHLVCCWTAVGHSGGDGWWQWDCGWLSLLLMVAEKEASKENCPLKKANIKLEVRSIWTNGPNTMHQQKQKTTHCQKPKAQSNLFWNNWNVG